MNATNALCKTPRRRFSVVVNAIYHFGVCHEIKMHRAMKSLQPPGLDSWLPDGGAD